MQKTYSAKPSDFSRAWFILDASKMPLGRIATEASKILSGKNKPIFTSHIDCGDHLIIINSDKLIVTGTKEKDKTYYRHSGYIGNLKEISLQDQRAKDSTKILITAIKGMLPVNKLRDGRMTRLKVYTGEAHNHEAQQPKPAPVFTRRANSAANTAKVSEKGAK